MTRWGQHHLLVQDFVDHFQVQILASFDRHHADNIQEMIVLVDF